jgi:hypothetical protein
MAYFGSDGLVWIGKERADQFGLSGAGEFAVSFAGTAEEGGALHDFLGEQWENQEGKTGLTGGLLGLMQRAAKERQRQCLAQFGGKSALQSLPYLIEPCVCGAAGGRGWIVGAGVFHGAECW